MEKIFSLAWADKHGSSEIGSNNKLTNTDAGSNGGQSLQRKNLVDTTLLVHFFGKKGNVTLQYEDFRRSLFIPTRTLNDNRYLSCVTFI